MSDVELLGVRKWREYNHYQDEARKMRWFKMYPKIIDGKENADLVGLSIQARFLAVVMLCLAAKHDNEIPNIPQWIAFQASIPVSTVKKCLPELLDIRFVVPHASIPAFNPASNSAIPKKLEKPRESRELDSLASRPKKVARKPDPLWDALVLELGGAPATEMERGRWNKALKEIRDAGGTADDITARSKKYRKQWPEIALTPTGLASNWSQLRVKVAASPPCEMCGVGGGRHASDCVAVTPMSESELRNLARNMP